MLLRTGVTVAAFVVVTASPALSSDMPVPLDLQAALFKKIFGYDRTLKNRGELLVMVVYTGSESEVTRSVVKAFRDTGVASQSVAAGDLPGHIADVAVVYVGPGVPPEAVAELCASHGVLTVSGIPELALRGEVAIGIGIADQKPQILVHLRRLKTEGHDLAWGLLEVATVVR